MSRFRSAAGELLEPIAAVVGAWLASLRTLAELIRRPNRADLRGDANGALAAAMLGVPQSMGFALLAGVSPVMGVWTMVVQALLSGLFSASPLVTIGPTNTHSLLVAATLTRVLDGDAQMYMQAVVTLTLLKGVFQLLFAACRMGAVVRYISPAVAVGFTAGSGILIATGQLKNVLGTSAGGLEAIQLIAADPGLISWAAVLVAACAAATLVICPLLGRWLPAAVLAVASGGLLIWLVLPEGAVPTVGSLSIWTLPHAWPGFTTLSGSQLDVLLLGGASLAMLGLLEAHSVARAVAGQGIGSSDPNRELSCQGLTNLLSGFSGCMPGSASFTRSALFTRSGARTQISSLLLAAFGLCFLLAIGSLGGYVAIPALAGVLVVIGLSLIRVRTILGLIRQSRTEAAVCLVTLGATLTLPLAYAVYAGMLLNVAIFLRRATRLHICEMVRLPSGAYHERPVGQAAARRQVVFLNIEGDLFFGVADELATRFEPLACPSLGRPRVVIVRLRRTHSIDATAAQVLRQFAQRLRELGGALVICGLSEALRKDLLAGGQDQPSLDEQDLISRRQGVFEGVQLALARAGVILGRPVTTADLIEDDDPNDPGWAWQI